MKLKIANTILASIVAVSASAVPSRMRPVEVVQPDGSSLTVVAHGDEHFHYYATVDNVPLSLASDGFRYYASALNAHNPGQRSPEEIAAIAKIDRDAVVKNAVVRRKMPRAVAGPQHTSSFPTKGEHHFLVILVEFPNKRFVVPNAGTEFLNMLNKEGYSNYNATGSAADYYHATSSDQFQPIFDVYGPVMMDHGYEYYGGGSDDSAAGAMIVEACRKIDSEADFSIYDTDGDGEVDNVYVFYAGLGEADGGDPSTIWPHSWNLSDQDREAVFDGVKVESYACSPELDGQSKMNGIGTFCHEFAHVLGLPDLYNTSSMTTALTPGDWSLMDRGSYTNDGRTPPLMSGYERYELNWTVPQVVSHPKNLTILPIVNNVVYRINTERDNEYFILENRQQSGWDAFVPGHGMLVWHIDYNPNIWDRNVVNRDPNHQYVDIVEANGGTSSTQAAGFPFPGSGKVTKLTGMTSWSGYAIDLPLTDIVEVDGNVVLKVAGGKADIMPPVLGVPVDVTQTSMTLQWSAVHNAVRYFVDVTAADGVKAYSHFDVGSSTTFSATRLSAGTTYSCSVTAADAFEESAASNVVTATTLPATFDMLQPKTLPASSVSDSGFTANWEELDGAVAYQLTVCLRNRGGFSESVCDFTGKVLADGWSTLASTFNSAPGFYGEAMPALRFEADGESLTSPLFSGDIRKISFWHRASRLSEGDALVVNGEYGDGWRTLATVAAVKDKGGLLTTVDESRGEIADGCRRMRLSMNGKGIVAVDDVVVEYGGEASDTPVAGYDGIDVGGSTSAVVTGLVDNSRYVYSVRAFNGSVYSMPSEFVEVRTGNDAVASVAAPANFIVEDGGIRMLLDGVVSVWGIDGVCCFNGNASSGTLIELRGGVYVVRTADGVGKCVVR